MDPDHVTFEDPSCHKYVWSPLAHGRIITLRALASKRKQRSSASHVLFNIARQRGPLGPEKAIWACLTASNHEIHQYLSRDGSGD